MDKACGRLICVFSGKGGVGKTTLTVNLAGCLAQKTPGDVLLLDVTSSPSSGLASFIGVRELPALTQVASSSSPSGSFWVRNHVAQGPEGLHLMALRDFSAPAPSPPCVSSWLSLLRESYRWILVDLGSPWEEASQPVLSQADLILHVLTPDPLALEGAQGDRERLQSVGIPLVRVQAVLNRFGVEAHRAESEKMLRTELFAEIPEDPQSFAASVMTKKPLCSLKSTRAGAAIQRLAIRTLGVLQLPGDKPDHSPQSRGLSLEERRWLKRRTRSRLLAEMDLKRLKMELNHRDVSDRLRNQVETVVMSLLEEDDPSGSLSPDLRREICAEVLDECLGYGPIQNFIDDPTITEVMVNGIHSIYVERDGRIIETPRRFESDEDVLGVMERILAPLGRRVDEQSPMADGRLPDGSRVNAVIRPLAVDGPALTIRKFSKAVMGPEDLLKTGSLDPRMLAFLCACVKGRISLLITGGTGSGKTTLLNALSSFIPMEERIITIEDAAELLLLQPHVVRLESRPPGIEGKNQVTIRQLVVNALRMRPSRIIVGECRSGEALDMLQAMNTGHAGSMTTLHANSPRDALSRLETLVLMAGEELPSRAIRDQIASAISLIVHLERFSDGSRRVVAIADLRGLNGDVFDLQEIFTFHKEKIDAHRVIGQFQPSGVLPSCLTQIERESVALEARLFDRTMESASFDEGGRL